MDLEKIIKNAFGVIDWVLDMVLPGWWGKAKVLLVQAVAMVEATATTEKGDAKRKKAIDVFEAKLVQEGLIPEGVEKAFDPVIDWALEWAIDALVKYLNKAFGKDWVKVIAPSKVQNPA